jgi:hypothetical protein
MEWTTIMAVLRINAAVAAARKEIADRLQNLFPAVMEYRILEAQLEIIEAADKKIAKLEAKVKELQRPAATKFNVDKWAKALPPDEIVRAADLAATFGKYDSWARNHLNRLVDAGIMEKWGKGQYRQKPDRAGTATLRVVSR